MAADENRFALELNEKEVVEQLEHLSNILMKQLFYSLRASLAIHISYPTRARGIIVLRTSFQATRKIDFL